MENGFYWTVKCEKSRQMFHWKTFRCSDLIRKTKDNVADRNCGFNIYRVNESLREVSPLDTIFEVRIGKKLESLLYKLLGKRKIYRKWGLKKKTLE